MMPNLIRALWGDLSSTEIKKFGILSATLMLIMGNYWMLRPIKNTLFKSLVGFTWQPTVKILSLVVMMFVVLGYSKLVDILEKDKLFYVICSFYGILFLFTGWVLAHPDFFIPSPSSFLHRISELIPGKTIGWIAYVSFESFGSIVAALFWSFVACTTTTESAKKGYGMVVSMAQVGALIGLFFVLAYSKILSLASFVFIGGVLVLLVPFLIKFYMHTIDEKDVHEEKNPKLKSGFFEGIKIILTNPYVMGIFVVTTFYEIMGIILEYQMYRIAEVQFPLDSDFAAFNSEYGIGIILLALLFALVGTSFFMRRFGLRTCLIAFPATIGILMSAIFLFKTFGASTYQFMWAICGAMIAIKGVNYALNNPSKEVLYIPTNKAVKFKAKGWIDIFGGRSVKGVGAGINNIFRTSLPNLLLYGTVISLGVIGVWIVIASIMGTTFNRLQHEKRIIE
jgi:ATP:ADP antiporter, AAA family